MTTLEILRCFLDDKWYNYQSLLDYHETIPDRIEYTLPESAVDSYLGRLVELALYVKDCWKDVTIDTLDGYFQVLEAMRVPRILESRPVNSHTLDLIRDYLYIGLPASWVEPVAKVFMPALWTKYRGDIGLNDNAFYKALCAVHACDYPGLRSWFANHPRAVLRDTTYTEGGI